LSTYALPTNTKHPMKNPHAVTEVDFYHALSPLSMNIADSTHHISKIAFIVTRIRLNNGTIGESYLLSFHYSPNAIAGALKDVKEHVIDYDVSQTGQFLRQIESETEYFGHDGIHRWAMGAINIAMWDAWGKTLGQPVWKLWGSYHKRVPLYGSGGWLSYTMEELLDEVVKYKKRGFKAVKIKVGSSEPGRDMERLSKVREALGPDISIMMDANQGMNYTSAKDLAEQAKRLKITWFEEPLPNTDFDGYMKLQQHTGMALAMGEREFNTVALRSLLERRAIDLWQPDILRLGGVEAWRASASLAHAYHVPVLPHFYKEYDVPLLMTIPNARGAESFDWVDPLITNPVRMEDGWAYPHEGSGWGFHFKDQYLTELG